MNKDINTNNHDVIKLKKKLKKYNDVIKSLVREENLDKDIQSSSYKSVIIDNYIDGRKKKVLPSHLGESFLIIEEVRDLDELNKSEQIAIRAQDNLSTLDKTKKYIKRINNSYGWICSVVGVGRVLLTLIL